MTPRNHSDQPGPDETMAITMDEHLLTLTEATAFVPGQNSKRPSVSTVWRWCRKGLNGVQLEYVRCGRKILTSHEALGRFFRRLAAADTPPNSSAGDPPPTPTNRGMSGARRSRDVSASHARLDEEGL